MKKKGWLWILGMVVIGVGVGGYLLYRNVSGGPTAALAAQGNAAELATVARGTLRVSVEGSGSLTPEYEVAVSFQSGGKVTAVLVDVGDMVQAGDALVQLDDADARRSVTEAELQVQQSQASLKSAQLKLDDLVSWTPDASAVELAQANLEAAQTEYTKTLTGDAREGAQLVSVRVKLDQAERALADAQEAYTSAYDPGREWELGDRFRSGRLETERETATANLQRAKEDLEVAQANYTLQVVSLGDSDVKSAWSKVVNARVALEREQTAPDTSDIESARIQVEQAEITLAQSQLKLNSAQQTLADLTLTAPVSGVVTTLNAAVGQMLGGSQAAVVLADLHTLTVEIGLDESDIVQVAVGMPALVTLDAFDASELRGSITHIAPTAQAQSGVVLYAVTIALDPTSLPVRAGMTADVEIATRSAEDVLVIPLKAVRSMEGGNFVLRQLRAGETPPANAAEGTATPGFVLTPVALGFMTDTQAEVLSGLEEGDVVSVATAAPAAENGGADIPMGMPGSGIGSLMRRP
ncbi:MAG TPA: HlyD family efflux transporter periplasmic adaptor subunit [Anaerolineae bacterium]|nr:HlyD family efflux transporter periplasmic adaptor subunit [Anaerolineae bacterium]